MNNLAVLNRIHVSPWSHTPLNGGPSPVERSEAFARSLPGVNRVIGFEGQKCSQEDLAAFLLENAKDYDHVFYLFADAPFYRQDLARAMWENHIRYRAQYSFADGFPFGLTPEILSVRSLGALNALATGQGSPSGREGLFTILSRDINAFDIETELSPVDLRALRLSLTTDSKRNRLFCEREAAAAGGDLRAFLEHLKEDQSSQRTLPSYIQIQVTDGVLQAPSYSPILEVEKNALQRRDFMDPGRLTDLLSRVEEFCCDAVINPSLWGEPSLYPAWPRVLSAAAAHSGLRWLVETSGLNWPEEVLDAFEGYFRERIDWIVELDSLNPETYTQLRGPGFEAAFTFIETAEKKFPGHVWPQAVRMKSTEEEMEGFYRHWKEKLGRVIIQKYNHFSGRRPDLKVTDLSPFTRPACWHLKRDLTIFMDGTAVLCRDDYQRTNILGNAFEEDLATIWARGEDYHRRHLKRDYPALCGNCDEYYTFNF